MSTPSISPADQQVLDQNSDIADALFDVAEVLNLYNRGVPMDDSRIGALLQDAKTKINALNPEKFNFS